MKVREIFRPAAQIVDSQAVMLKDTEGNDTRKVDHKASAEANFASAKKNALESVFVAPLAVIAGERFVTYANSPALGAMLNTWPGSLLMFGMGLVVLRSAAKVAGAAKDGADGLIHLSMQGLDTLRTPAKN